MNEGSKFSSENEYEDSYQKRAELNVEIARLRKEGKQATVESSKAWGEVEKIMGRFGIRFKHK